MRKSEKVFLLPSIIEIVNIQPRKNQCGTGSGGNNFCTNGTGK